LVNRGTVFALRREEEEHLLPSLPLGRKNETNLGKGGGFQALDREREGSLFSVRGTTG